ncbi:jg2506, partial [Pararge aegeria aegeria]
IKGQLLNIILPTPGSLPESANQLAKPARALLMRLLEKDPKVRLRNLRQLQQSAFYLGFNFERIKSKKMSPKCVLENHLASKSSADLYNAKNIKKQEFIEFDQEAVLL